MGQIRICTLFIVFHLLVLHNATQAATIYVDAGATQPVHDGTSWCAAFLFVQDALGVAQAGDIIRVAQGTYKPDEGAGQTPGDRAASFELISGVALEGGFAGCGEPDPDARDFVLYETILSADLLGDDAPVSCTQNSPDCNSLGSACFGGTCASNDNMDENSYHVVIGSGTSNLTLLEGFTITGGNADGDDPWEETGGGVFCDGGNLTIRNCLVSGNTAVDDGGGIYLYRHSDATISGCLFSRNYAAGSGGGLLNWLSTSSITECVFSENVAIWGGGLNTWDSDLSVTDSSFLGNIAWNHGGAASLIGEGFPVIARCLVDGNASGNGGGIVCNGRDATITNCILSNNTASKGGAIYTSQGRLSLANSVIVDNASAEGGGIYVWADGEPTIINCTISGNSGNGGAVYCTADARSVVRNSILWANSPQELVTSGDCEMTVSYSDVLGGPQGVGGTGSLTWGPGNIDVPPLFVGPDDYHLSLGSPCIDAGDPSFEAETDEVDFDAEARTFNDRVDIGTDEHQDCNANDVADYLDIENGSSTDCTMNTMPDECEPDCNGNGVADSCDIADGFSVDCTSNGVPDECEADCNVNGVADSCDIAAQTSEDCNANGVPDECLGLESDCNGNGTPDACDTANSTSQDCDGNAVPDECEDTTADCDGNGVWDPCDLTADESVDVDRDGVIDVCEQSLMLYVDDDAPFDPGPGNPAISDPDEDGSQTHPFDAIQEAILAAIAIEDGAPGTDYLVTITVQDGTYDGVGNRDIVLQGRPYLVRSANGPSTCTIDCQSSGRALVLSSGETAGTRIQGFTIVNGQADWGGGIICEGDVNAIFSDCVITGNTATYGGGGIYGETGCRATFANCEISGNAAAAGGGFYLAYSSSATITDCLITANTSVSFQGGGIACDEYSHATISRCLIVENTADSVGGGISCTNVSNATISDCVISRNISGHTGGGIYYGASHPSITGCVITENTAEVAGGGIQCDGAFSTTITNCLIAGNTTLTYYGGGVDGSNCLDLNIRNCTIVGNTGVAAGGLRLWWGYANVHNSIILGNSNPNVGTGGFPELTVEYSNVEGGPGDIEGTPILIWGDGNIDADPLFLDPDGPDDDPDTWDDNNLRLSIDSPCIDAGDNDAIPIGITTDLDGNPRLTDVPSVPDTGNPGAAGPPVVDMGPYEHGDCNGNGIPDEQEIADGTADDCNENNIPDECEIAIGSASDINGNGIPDTCEQPFVATLSATGPRYFSLSPAFETPEPVAFRVTSPDYGCLVKYVDPTGLLVDEPAFQPAADWGSVDVHGEAVFPDTLYEVEAVFDTGELGDSISVTTWVWGDCDNNGSANLADTQLVVLGFQGDFSLASLQAVDLEPCLPNGVANLADALQSVLAFQGVPFTPSLCTEPCP